jgi:hypothetical protein
MMVPLNPRLPFVLIVLVAAITTQSADAPARGRNPPQLARRLSAYRPAPLIAAPRITLPELSAQAACVPPVHFKRLRGVIDRAVLKAAPNQLDLPLGGARFVTLHGKRYLFCLEQHFHEPGSGEGPDGWHKGVTVYDATETIHD